MCADTLNVQKKAFAEILDTAEDLVDEVEEVFQDQVARKRRFDIERGDVEGKTEEELDEYLKSRGVNIE